MIDEAAGSAQVTDTSFNNALASPPLIGAAPPLPSSFSPSGQWNGSSLTWETAAGAPVSILEAATSYRVTVTLTARSGWTFNGLRASSFTYTDIPGAVVSGGGPQLNGSKMTFVIDFTLQQTDVSAGIAGDPSLIEQLDWIKAHGEPCKNYLVLVTRSETIAPYTLDVGQNNNLASIGIMLKSTSDTYQIRPSENGPLFTLRGYNSRNEITLILDAHINLRGRDANNNAVVWVDNNAVLIMNEGASIRENTGTTYNGGGVFNNGTFTMHGGTISHTKASKGGGVFNNGTFTMHGGTISYTEAYNGGGVFNSGTFTMHGGIITQISVDGNGGGVYNNGGNFTMNSGEISNNNAVNGGGIYVDNYGTTTIHGGVISINRADNNGGGIYNNGSSFTMNNGKILNNRASFDGGGVYSFSRVSINGGIIGGNQAHSGGGVFVSGSNVTFTKTGNSIIYGDTDHLHTEGSTENTASENGNAVMYAVDSNGGKKRDSTAGVGVSMSSDLLGARGGWE
ncbi:MAG: hypothetical protein LBD20_01645 [Spirochaetaceae bacterium]|nr:hypothetical protein [Spirochaetaceae bacterium]